MNTKGRLLVVENERDTADSLRAALVAFGYDVLAVAATGQEALEKGESLKPDLVVMDIQLNGDMDGIQAALQFRQRMYLPVVFLTDAATDDVVERGKVAEPLGYIFKPYDERQLYCVVETALHSHRTEQMLRRGARHLHDWREDAERIRGLIDGDGTDAAYVAVDTFTSLTMRNVIAALENLKYLVDNMADRRGAPDACRLLQCPRRVSMEDGIRDAIRTLEKTKGAFKSKELGALRQRLETVLENGGMGSGVNVKP